MTLSEIAKAVDVLDPTEMLPVCITGGEPVLQLMTKPEENVRRVLMLHNALDRRRLWLETNGDIALPMADLDEFHHISVSPKAAISTLVHGVWNKKLFRFWGEIRLVWPHPVYANHGVDAVLNELMLVPDIPIVISPLYMPDAERPNETNLHSAIRFIHEAAMRGFDVRLSTQSHKLWRIQ
jgi:organic radical activating enzyme